MRQEFSLLAGRTFDLLVCGGGIYGAWTAYDATLRGLKVLLVEQGDWASATSSSSSKLIHGGLRYLETFDFKLVRKALKERNMLLDLAPHRIWPIRFGVPIYQAGRIGMLRMKVGLSLYDILAGLPDHDFAHMRFNHQQFVKRFPFLKEDNLLGGFTYGDAQTDDARLVLELISGAIAGGAVCLNYCQLTELIESEGKAKGATICDQIDNHSATVLARQIVYSTGRWAAQSEPGHDWCRLSKGVHLVMPGMMTDEALLLTAKTDGRVFFIIPWYGMTLIGTTDNDYRGESDNVAVDEKDIEYLLGEANTYLKTLWTSADIVGSYAGVRVMMQSDKVVPSDISRDWELKTASNGVHYSIGGKLTSAREDAAQIVNLVSSKLGMKLECVTQSVNFPWSPEEDFAIWFESVFQSARRLGIVPEITKWLIRRHGRRVNEVLSSIEESPHLAERIHPSLPFIYADLLFCARTEMVVHLEDLLRRRMPLLILAKFSKQSLLPIANFVASVLNWDESKVNQEVILCLK